MIKTVAYKYIRHPQYKEFMLITLSMLFVYNYYNSNFYQSCNYYVVYNKNGGDDDVQRANTESDRLYRR